MCWISLKYRCFLIAPIGAAEGEEAVQRRKERYRQELLEQIAEQRKNKKKWVHGTAVELV